MALGHTLLVICYHLLERRCTYQDLGADYFFRTNAENLRKYHVERLKQLGYDVHLTNPAAAWGQLFSGEGLPPGCGRPAAVSS